MRLRGDVPVSFNNGLSEEDDATIDNMIIALARMRLEIEELGKHRAYSLAITKLEEAEHWLNARKHST